MKKCILVYNQDRKVGTSIGAVDYIKEAINSLGYECKIVPFSKDFISVIDEEQPDIVFNYYTATGFSQCMVPYILDWLKILYTGSGPVTQVLAIDKEYTSIFLIYYNIPVPQFSIVRKGEEVNFTLPFPVIVKPACGGSSEGISKNSVVRAKEELNILLEDLFNQGFDKLLISSFIEGREFTVGIIGNRFPSVLGILETSIKPDEILTKELKDELEVYDKRVTSYTGPLYEKIKEVALLSYKVLGCKDYARIDIRLGRDDVPYVIDVNALPGLHPYYSYIPRITEDTGLGYRGLIERIIKENI